MPELPEVEITRRGLARVMERERIVGLEARRPDLRFPLPEKFAARMTGNRVERLNRRGKHLIFELESGDALIAHLGMSGSFTIAVPREAGPGLAAGKHDHVIIHMANGVRVTFNDPRRFGFMVMTKTADLDAHACFVRMGPEPLSNAFSGVVLKGALAGRAAPIKAALLDQSVVAGIGNIYACEALFRAGVNPKTPAGRISAARIERLAAAVRDVLEDAIAAGGSTLRDYAQTDGSLGYFQHAFEVYGRGGDPCVNDICCSPVAVIRQSGRSTFYCPRCQR